MLEKFITRPVMATVVSLILVLLGIVAIIELPITRFPVIAPPSVSVSASYSGADAATIAHSVLLPLESGINGVKGMTYMQSQASTGGGTVTVYFKQGTNPHQASVKVQNRVSQALSDLPEETVNSGVSVTPRQSGVVMTLTVYSVDPSAINETFLNVYANRVVDRTLTRVDGVASVDKVGSRNYAIRIWLKPNKMKAHSLEPSDIKKAVDSQNFVVAPGEFGQNSNQTFERLITYTGRLTTQEEFGNIVVKTNKDGSILHLKDVARVELGPTNAHNVNQVNGHPGLTINVSQEIGSNARDIDIAVRKKMKELSKNFPNGLKYNISYSIRNQIDGSIDQVLHTLVEAFILVFIVVFIFLQNLRATIIPAIAIPVSLVGTFFFIYILGFSINVLTMFALVLAIGIVVDDAIIVVEAIHQKMESTSLSPQKATIATMKEITPAIISITMVMAAVFFPIGIMGGPSGVFYRQFAYTLAVAILISALNALTLSPALCALVLKRSNDTPDESKVHAGSRFSKERIKADIHRFFAKFNTSFETITRKYIKAIKYLAGRKKLAITGLILIVLAGLLLLRFTPTAFIPQEDNGFITYSIKLPPSSSLARTANAVNKAIDILKGRKEIRSMSSSAGYNSIDGTNGRSYATGYISMYPYGERKGITDINRFIDTLRADLSQIKGASIFISQRPTISGFGKKSGIHFVLEDKLGGSFQAFGAVADTFLNALNKRPEILKASTTFQPNVPKYKLQVKKNKAMAMGVNIKDMLKNIRMYYSRVKISEFNLLNRQNSVYIQAAPQYSATPKSLKNIYVRNKNGQMVPVSTLVKLTKTVGPEIVTRYNLYNSIEINATPAKGYSTGQAMTAVEEVAANRLPGNYKYEWTGMSRAANRSGQETLYIILLSFLFVYLLLSAKYESYIIPFSILLSVPVGLIGVYIAVNLVGLQNNIYVQVGLIMLIGLLGKNAILMVEYSQQQRQEGHSIYESAIKGARLRLRPILMTSFAFVAGLIPLMWAQGPSAQGNHSISFGAAGGMISGVLFGIFIIPVLYIIFRTIDEKFKAKFNNEG